VDDYTLGRRPPDRRARRADQLADNLGAVDVELPPDARVRLDKATGFRHWFPTTFIQDTKP
jgi:hypothetical protein